MEQLERVRRADPDNWEALGLEARIHFQEHRYEQAVDRAVESLSLIYFQPACTSFWDWRCNAWARKRKPSSPTGRRWRRRRNSRRRWRRWAGWFRRIGHASAKAACI